MVHAFIVIYDIKDLHDVGNWFVSKWLSVRTNHQGLPSNVTKKLNTLKRKKHYNVFAFCIGIRVVSKNVWAHPIKSSSKMRNSLHVAYLVIAEIKFVKTEGTFLQSSIINKTWGGYNQKLLSTTFCRSKCFYLVFTMFARQRTCSGQDMCLKVRPCFKRSTHSKRFVFFLGCSILFFSTIFICLCQKFTNLFNSTPSERTDINSPSSRIFPCYCKFFCEITFKF